jgi:hypothetical protein
MESLEGDLTVSLMFELSNSKCESDDELAERTIDKNRRELWRMVRDSRLRATCFPILRELVRLIDLPLRGCSLVALNTCL